jgi:excisionase family DNA binding protein
MVKRQPELLSVSAAAKLLNCSEQTIRNWERRGSLVASRLSNGTRLFLREHIEKVAHELDQKPASQTQDSRG